MPRRKGNNEMYNIYVSGTAEGLAEKVDAALAAGWKLHGGVSVAQSFETHEDRRRGYAETDTAYTFAQAMTREESANDLETWCDRIEKWSIEITQRVGHIEMVMVNHEQRMRDAQ